MRTVKDKHLWLYSNMFVPAERIITIKHDWFSFESVTEPEIHSTQIPNAKQHPLMYIILSFQIYFHLYGITRWRDCQSRLGYKRPRLKMMFFQEVFHFTLWYNRYYIKNMIPRFAVLHPTNCYTKHANSKIR